MHASPHARPPARPHAHTYAHDRCPLAALSVLDGHTRALLSWRAIFRGQPAERALAALGLSNVRVHRVGRSLRYGSISEASFCTEHNEMGAWRDAAAAAGFPVVGDRPHCDGPSVCLWVASVRVVESSGGGSEEAAAEAEAPARFAKLFEREEAVCRFADAGKLSTEYCLRFAARDAAERESREGPSADEKEGVVSVECE